MGKHRVKPNYRRRVLRLPDLDHCKLAVLNSLGSPASRRVYQYAIDQFVAWYCSEPRLAFNRIVVVRYRMHLESRGLAANTINQQLAAVRRLAHEAADAGLLSPELAAGISRVKGVKQLGFRSGNWLSAEQSFEVLQRADGDDMRAKRDYAMLAMLFGCGFRRSELVGLELDEIQLRQGHWAVVDLIGKGGHIRTVPIPSWVKAALDQWTAAAGKRLFEDSCSRCHGAKLEGGSGPALSGITWTQKFGGAKLLTVWGEIKGPMAEYAGRAFTTQQSLDILAYLLQQNGLAAGDQPLLL